MNKYLSICIAFVAALALAGCSGDSTSKRLVGTYAGNVVAHTQTSLTIAQEITSAAQLFFGETSTGITGLHNYGYYTYSGSSGGSMYFSGSCPSAYNGIYTWTLTATDTISSFGFQYNSVTYTMNGTVNITGKLYQNTNGGPWTTSSYVSIIGTYYVSGNGVSSQSVSVNVTIVPNSNGSAGGTISGTVGGQSVNQSFSL